MKLLIIALILVLGPLKGWATEPISASTTASNQMSALSVLSGKIESLTPPPDIPILDSTSLPSISWSITEEEIGKAFEASSELICIMEAGKNFKKLNQKWTEILGWEVQELLGRSYIGFLHPEDSQRILSQRKEIIPYNPVTRFRCKNGAYRFLSWTELSRRDRSDKTEPFFLVRDVTLEEFFKRENQEQIKSLNESLQFKDKIIQAIIQIQWDYLGKLGTYEDEYNVDQSFQILIRHFINITNSEFGFIAGVNKQEKPLVGNQQVWELHPCLALSKETLDFFNSCQQIGLQQCLFKDYSDKLLLKGAPLILNNIEDSVKLSNASEIPAALKSFLGIPLIMRDKVDETVGIIGLANRQGGYDEHLIEWLSPLFLVSTRIANEVKLKSELTSQKHDLEEAEQERDKAKQGRDKAEKAQGKAEAAQEKAEAANISKSAFLAQMSHEIRTPLGGVIGLLGLIDITTLNEENKNYIQDSKATAESLLTILNDILDWSKVEAGFLHLEEIEFNPLAITQEVLKLFKFQSEKKGNKLTLTTSPEIPENVIGDPTRLRQILFNLIGNAVKFTSQGKVNVSLKGNVSSNKDKQRFELIGKVKDTGIGISPAALPYLFQPFTQADPSITRKFGGTGLGLYVTKQLCELMGGEVRVRSEVDKGSIFQFKVYLGLPALDSSTVVSIPTVLVDPKLSDMQILVAEDNEANQTILKVLLTKAEAKVDIVWNGKEALEAVQRKYYDIILMDGTMAIMDGLEATRRIRLLFDANTLPIIGVTAHAFSEDRERFLKAGMNSYLTKPIQKASLFKEILRCLQNKTLRLQEAKKELK